MITSATVVARSCGSSSSLVPYSDCKSLCAGLASLTHNGIEGSFFVDADHVRQDNESVLADPIEPCLILFPDFLILSSFPVRLSSQLVVSTFPYIRRARFGYSFESFR